MSLELRIVAKRNTNRLVCCHISIRGHTEAYANAGQLIFERHEFDEFLKLIKGEESKIKSVEVELE